MHDRELLLARHRIGIGAVIERPVLARGDERAVRDRPHPARARLVEDDGAAARHEHRPALVAEGLAAVVERRSGRPRAPQHSAGRRPARARRRRPRRRARSGCAGVPSTAAPPPATIGRARAVDRRRARATSRRRGRRRARRHRARRRRPPPVVGAAVDGIRSAQPDVAVLGVDDRPRVARRGDRRRRHALDVERVAAAHRRRRGCRSAAPSRRRASS